MALNLMKAGGSSDKLRKLCLDDRSSCKIPDVGSGSQRPRSNEGKQSHTGKVPALSASLQTPGLHLLSAMPCTPIKTERRLVEERREDQQQAQDLPTRDWVVVFHLSIGAVCTKSNSKLKNKHLQHDVSQNFAAMKEWPVPWPKAC